MATSAGGLLRTAAARHYVEHFPQTTVDAAVSAQYGGRAPDLLKLDVQGYGWPNADVTYDICGLTRRPFDDALWKVDIIFIRQVTS